MVKAVVTEEGTGALCTHEICKLGQVRNEMLYFRVREPLVALTRTCETLKKFPFVGFTKVGADVLLMGDYEPQDALHTFEMPKATIPTTTLARGPYKVEVRYTASSHEGVVLTHIKNDFTIV